MGDEPNLVDVLRSELEARGILEQELDSAEKKLRNKRSMIGKLVDEIISLVAHDDSDDVSWQRYDDLTRACAEGLIDFDSRLRDLSVAYRHEDNYFVGELLRCALFENIQGGTNDSKHAVIRGVKVIHADAEGTLELLDYYQDEKEVLEHQVSMRNLIFFNPKFEESLAHVHDTLESKYASSPVQQEG